jgi:hypothetical protein
VVIEVRGPIVEYVAKFVDRLLNLNVSSVVERIGGPAPPTRGVNVLI